MSKINALDLKALLSGSLIEVFDSMFSMTLEIADINSYEPEEGHQVIGLSEFSGELTGNIYFQSNNTLARIMTAFMLDMEPEDIEDDEEVNDVIREVMNILGGNLKSGISGAGALCEFASPLLLNENEFEKKNHSLVKPIQFAFNYEQHSLLAGIHLDSNEEISEAEDQQDVFTAQADDSAAEADDGADDTEQPKEIDQFEIEDDEGNKFEIFGTADEADDRKPVKPEDQPDVSTAQADDSAAEADDGADDIEQPKGIDQFEIEDDDQETLVAPDQSKAECEEVKKAPGTTDQFEIEDDEGSNDGADKFEVSGTAETVSAADDTEPVKAVEKNKKDKPYIRRRMSIAVVLIIACLLGLFTYKGLRKPKTSNKVFDLEKNHGSYTLKEIKKSQGEATIKHLIPEPKSLIDKKLAQASNLRDELLIKYQNIVDLKKYYKNGILEVENNILTEMPKVKTTSFDQAVKNKKIRLNLRIIQRRQSYIQKLDRPLQQLNMASEELLYIKRRTKIDMLSGRIFGDIDQDKLIKKIDFVITKHIAKTDGLSIETNDTASKSLEMIWKTIVEKEKTLKKQKPYISLEDKKNKKIWQEICDGNFQRKNELTRLSPEAAKYLSAWQGEWMLLNGLTELSPEAAKYLSAWQGDRLSLNGLKVLEDETAIYLLQWRGLHLELSGLRRLAHWKKSGGRLYLPERYKRQLDKIIKTGVP